MRASASAGGPPPRTLGELRRGERATVVAVEGKGPVHRRMVEMGLLPGSVVEVRRVAPLGDPIEVRVKGYELTLRASEAAGVLVTAEAQP